MPLGQEAGPHHTTLPLMRKSALVLLVETPRPVSNSSALSGKIIVAATEGKAPSTAHMSVPWATSFGVIKMRLFCFASFSKSSGQLTMTTFIPQSAARNFPKVKKGPSAGFLGAVSLRVLVCDHVSLLMGFPLPLP